MSAAITFLIVAAIVTTAWAAIAFLAWALIHGAALIEQREASE